MHDDEMRDGFLVTSHRKKLWNVEIGLINEFARICKKYNLRWFAYGGTLLGAVRHKGFIPWDDDVDILMFRPDYEKFKQVAAFELKEPYFLDLWPNYRWESKSDISAPDEQQYPLITIEQERRVTYHWPCLPFTKIRDNRTTFIEFADRPNFNQGVWIDIFCFDPVPPFENDRQMANFEIALEILLTAIFPNKAKELIKNGRPFLISKNDLETLFQMTYRQRAIAYETYLSKKFFESEKVARHFMHVYDNQRECFDSSLFSKIVYAPFEEIEVPIPIGYEQYLTDFYGDWRKMVIMPSHAMEYSADIPYSEYRQKSIFMK